MKAADIANIMATAAANAKKVGSANTGPSFFAGLQAQVGSPDAAAAMAARHAGHAGHGWNAGGAGAPEQTADQCQGAGGRSRGQGGKAVKLAREARRGRAQAGPGGWRNCGANLSEEDRAKLNDLRQKMQKATGEEQQKLARSRLQELMQTAGINRRWTRRRGRTRRARRAQGRQHGDGRHPRPEASRGERLHRGRPENANLPLPPEEDSQVQTLLRPGLLADVEIIVEKIPNAIHVPAQAVFEKGGNPTVYVLQKNGRFEPREVQLVEAERIHDGAFRASSRARWSRWPTRRRIKPTRKEEREEIERRRHGCDAGGGNRNDRVSHIYPELKMGLASLFAHKLRSLLTMLGMIFGVGAVVAMLSITAGAQKEMMSFIDQLGVNNIIVEAHEAMDRNELQTVRAISPGLTFRDFRAISENVSGLVAITPRKRFKPQKLLPKTVPGAAPADRRVSELRGDQQPEADCRPLLHRRGEPVVGARSACWARPPRSTCWATTTPSASTSRSTTPGCR